MKLTRGIISEGRVSRKALTEATGGTSVATRSRTAFVKPLDAPGVGGNWRHVPGRDESPIVTRARKRAIEYNYKTSLEALKKIVLKPEEWRPGKEAQKAYLLGAHDGMFLAKGTNPYPKPRSNFQSDAKRARAAWNAGQSAGARISDLLHNPESVTDILHAEYKVLPPDLKKRVDQATTTGASE